MIDRCFDSRMQLNVQLISEGPSRNSTACTTSQSDGRVAASQQPTAKRHQPAEWLWVEECLLYRYSCTAVDLATFATQHRDMVLLTVGIPGPGCFER
eukprot:COSAG01_NODE_641_length_14573_cov_17.634637_13_plen_97_part_00